MKDRRAGQATFLPLDTIQPKPLQEKYRNVTKGAKLALEILQFEPQFEKAILYASGSAIVCDTVDVAKYVVYEKSYEVKCVTLDGVVFHKTGMITGGDYGKSGVKRWEEKEVQCGSFEFE